MVDYHIKNSFSCGKGTYCCKTFNTMGFKDSFKPLLLIGLAVSQHAVAEDQIPISSPAKVYNVTLNVSPSHQPQGALSNSPSLTTSAPTPTESAISPVQASHQP